MKLNLNRAFTLIEMLVVISLIGILAALALASFGGAQKQARDATRKSDLKQYQTALEMYGNLTNGLFPSSAGSTIDAFTTLCKNLNIILEPDISCSQDPKQISNSTARGYQYVSNGSAPGSPSATRYFLYVLLENKTAFWVVCSNGKSGETTTIVFSQGVCPI